MEKEELLSQVVTLWPHLNFIQRYDWVKRFQIIFDKDFVDTTQMIVEKVNGQGN